MVTRTIILKLDSEFLKEIDQTAKKAHYHNRTEFIRQSLRKGVTEEKLREAMKSIEYLKGKFRKGKQTTDEEIERRGERAYKELQKEKAWLD